jgi:clathrin heavy chain
MQLNELLNSLSKQGSSKNIDLGKCIAVVKNNGYLALIKDFLKGVQFNNDSSVNEALNQIYLEEEDFESLISSIRQYQTFESSDLAYKLQKCE